MPSRVQRTRTKGGGMPRGAVYVGRPTKWGNPFRVWCDRGVWVVAYHGTDGVGFALRGKETEAETTAFAVALFREALTSGHLPVTVADVRRELRGKDLACWCALLKDGEEDVCHARVLLEIANEGEDDV